MRLAFILCFMLVLLPFKSWAHGWLKIKVATSEYAPYTSTEMEHNGYINHIIEQAFLETGVVVEFTSLPWNEALDATLKGEYDVLSYGNFVREREAQFWHSDPISAENLIFYVNKQSGPDQWSQLSELENRKIGITQGYLYNEELAEYIKTSPSIVKNATDKDNLAALIAGEIDMFPIDELTGWYLLQREFNQNQQQQVMPIKPFISTVTTHLLVPKGSSDSRLLLELFNKGLEELTIEGKLTRFKRLLKQGFYQHPQKPVNFDRR